ncbi:MAG: TonB-dependent vitamin B12 receptor [Xanthomonadales bacterium]|nr:TonB-dependent vitamin B12 receptor [Xanthomonadales bacterium]
MKRLTLNSLTVALVAALVTSSSVALAQDDDAQLEPVVVTASRGEQSLANTLAATTVIDRDDIDRLEPDSLPELLRRIPGVSISNNGGFGKESSLFLRGTESDQTLLLIDGVRVASATAGKAALQDIPVDQIERIEVVRGPYSSLYGSDAIGGVIQIFTRRPKGETSINGRLAIGSYDTRRASAGISGRGEHGWASLQLSHQRTDGINACRGYGAPIFAGCYIDEPDLDGYRNNSVSLNADYDFSDALRAEINALRANGFSEFDGGFANQADNAQQVLGGKLSYRTNGGSTFALRLGRQSDLAESFHDGVHSSDFNTHRREASLQVDSDVASGRLSAGFDWRGERVDSDTAFDRTRRTNRALFGQWLRSAEQWSLQASVRRDDDSQFGGATTGSLLGGWKLSEGLRLTASYGTAFRAPSFNELYYPGFSNPDLKPERSRSAELSLRGQGGALDWSINAYQTHIRDLIALDASWVPANIDRARIRGVELEAAADWAGWRWNGNLAWLDPRNDGGGVNDGNLLPRRARETARLDADRDLGDDWQFGFSVTAAGHRYDDGGNLSRLGGYATTDLRLGYTVNPDWSLQINAYNVFDREYETAAYYNQPDRHWLLSLRYGGN